MWRVGVDVGGTFTDLFAWEEKTGQHVSAKVLTTVEDRSLGVLQAIEKAGIPIEDISYLMHGTTTATNSLIERSYPDAAFVTTEGFRDTLEIGRQHRKFLYDPYQTKPKPIIRRRYRYTVPERMNVNGESERPLNRDAAIQIAKKIKAEGIKSVGVGFINSYINGRHEEEMRDILLEECPNIHVALSSETRPVFREHGRFVTTAVRGALMPVLYDYMERLEESLKDRGFSGRLLILKSSGGIMSSEAARNHPEEMLESGPAGGVAYAALLSEKCGLDGIVHTDVGGTSFDVSLVENGRGMITRDYELEWEMPIVVPMLDIRSVGAGGGSIAWIDQGGSLRVGPNSAGAEPGPVCYGLGGTEATLTDANLILGRLDPTLSGKMKLDLEGAKKAISKLAKEIGLPLLETAEGIVRIGCEYMGQAVNAILASKGRDPRDFTYVSFGGAGALHACLVAQSMNIPRVIVPPHAGVASALGATAMDLRHDVEHFYYTPVKSADPKKINQIIEDLEVAARQALIDQGFTDTKKIELIRTAQMRYVGQSYEVETPISGGQIREQDLKKIEEDFHSEHRKEYGVSSSSFDPAFVSFSVAAIGKLGGFPPITKSNSSKGNALKSKREVFFNGEWVECPVYDGDFLPENEQIQGPAVVEYEHACAVLPPRTNAYINEVGALVIDIEN